MTSQYIWIGIAVSVFVAGIGIGYGVWQSSTSGLAGMMMSPQQMNQMMNDPEAMQQMHSMMQNPDMMNQNMMGGGMGQMMIQDPS
ncbi:MAG: hypothetical protein ACR2LL_06060 [Nitrosopumilus sp.]